MESNKESSYIASTSGIKAKDKIGYAMGDLASCLVFGLTQSVLNKYYTDVLEIGVLSVMIMTIVARIWDAINDPIWGRIIDGAKPRKDGRYRHWIKVFAIPVALAAVLMFANVTGFAAGGKLAWIYITYILLGCCTPVSIFLTALLLRSSHPTIRSVLHCLFSGRLVLLSGPCLRWYLLPCAMSNLQTVPARWTILGCS